MFNISFTDCLLFITLSIFIFEYYMQHYKKLVINEEIISYRSCNYNEMKNTDIIKYITKHYDKTNLSILLIAEELNFTTEQVRMYIDYMNLKN